MSLKLEGLKFTGLPTKLDPFEAEVHGFRGPYIICPCLLEANITLKVGQHCVQEKALEIIEHICHE